MKILFVILIKYLFRCTQIYCLKNNGVYKRGVIENTEKLYDLFEYCHVHYFFFVFNKYFLVNKNQIYYKIQNWNISKNLHFFFCQCKVYLKIYFSINIGYVQIVCLIKKDKYRMLIAIKFRWLSMWIVKFHKHHNLLFMK